MDLSRYNNKKILILGLGREGLATLRFFLENCHKTELGVADKAKTDNFNHEIKELIVHNPNIKIFSGENYLSGINDYDIVIKTPGIPIHIPEIEQAYQKGKVSSQTEIFFEQCPGTIIGITGTKGKSTTSSIIYDIFKAAGKKVSLVGNIGTPMISFLKDAAAESFFVCELSAHQLYGLRKSPHVSVLLNIYPEHLDYYKDYNEYILAKANIAIHQLESDCLIYNSSNREAAGVAQKAISKKIAFNEYNWKYSGQTALIGKFNLDNAKVGAIIGREFGITDDIINSAIEKFKPLDNRLEFFGTYDGIDCYNDSLSTIQESAVAAIEGLGGRVQTLIAGGYERNQPFEKLADAILSSNISTLLLLPTTGQRIWSEVQNAAGSKGRARLARLTPFFVKSMEEAVGLALKNTKRGGICLLSAASASFGGFQDYADRGRQFGEWLVKLAEKKND
ncbi:MAG: UDP-N-acetylmuramoyl-L-alanine--D-glutamate ligase [Candidatus Paceibacterota bacterium]